MVQLAATEKCSGCMACAAACPMGAIGIWEDALGNRYPQIDGEKCVECGRCRRICPELGQFRWEKPGKAWAAWSLDPDSRKKSASGGAAAEFYARALEAGYWICGARWDHGKVIHTLTRDPADIDRFRQSKYVASDASMVYRPIEEKLKAGEKVLMISLPCKIAGLLGYLGKSYDNLLTVDIVCHGTPSEKLLNDHIAHVAPGIEGWKLKFRQENQFLFRLEKNEKIVYEKEGGTDGYLAAFLEGLNYRGACYRCSYARNERISDLTICDFWGLGTEVPFAHPYTGAVSAVLVNSPKGAAFLHQCRDRLFLEERPVAEAVRGNAQLNAPTAQHPGREEFEGLCAQYGFEAAVSKVLHHEIRAAEQQISRQHLRSGLRKLAGVFLKRYRG